MKLIESKAELVLQQEGLEGVYKQIEFCGRTCYKSEDKITEDSAKGFVDRMIKSNHTAMLEQGTVYLKIDNEDAWFKEMKEFYMANPFSTVCGVLDKGIETLYITTNFRVIVENKRWLDLSLVCEPTEHHEKRYTIKFTTDRGVSHKRFVA